MRRIRYPMIGLSALPTIPVLFCGAFLVLTRAASDNALPYLAVMWVWALCGAIGLVLASMESTYRISMQRVITFLLLVCGVFSMLLSIYYAFNLEKFSYHPIYGNGVKDVANEKMIYAFFLAWLILIWPLLSGVIAIRLCTPRN